MSYLCAVARAWKILWEGMPVDMLQCIRRYIPNENASFALKIVYKNVACDFDLAGAGMYYRASYNKFREIQKTSGADSFEARQFLSRQVCYARRGVQLGQEQIIDLADHGFQDWRQQVALQEQQRRLDAWEFELEWHRCQFGIG